MLLPLTGTDSRIFRWNHGVFRRARNSETCFLTRKNVIISSGFLLPHDVLTGFYEFLLSLFLWSVIDGVVCNFGSLNFWIGRSGVFKLFINWLSLGSLLVAQEKSPGSSTKGGTVIFMEEISVRWIPWRCSECLDTHTQSCSHHPIAAGILKS